MSSWAKKLETKLATLPDNASQESIQTVANWITFNRKHAAVISSTLTERLLQQQQQEQRNNLYWQLIHEIILAERDHPSKWEKLQDLRVALGEGLVTVLEQRSSPSEREVLPFLEEFDVRLKEWDDLNAFGGPSLISQLKRLYQSHKNHGVDGGGASVAAAETSGAVLEESKTAATTIQNDEETATAASPKAEEASTETAKTESSPTPRRSSFSQNNRQVEYDFESKNVPARKVETKEFLEPCKAIATLQIARDLRSDKHNEISAAIGALPEEILRTCRDMADGHDDVDAQTIKEYSFQIPTSLLDLNMIEEQSQLQTFQDILRQQIKARQKLIHLLLESRCQFGSHAAAKEYHDMDREIAEKLRRRKQLLSDALELEGLDTAEIDAAHAKTRSEKGTDDSQDLPPLTWYKPEEALEESATKKQRTD